MSNVWERFDSIASKEEVSESLNQFKPIEEGEYDAVLESIEPSESNNGLPMLKGKFRIVENNRVVFYNQMLQNLNAPNMTAVNIAEAVAFVGGLLELDVEFEGLSALASLVQTIPTGEVHRIKVSYTAKDLEHKFPKLKVLPKPEPIDFTDVPYSDGDGAAEFNY